MPINKDIRRLQKAWTSNVGWPKRLEWLEIKNLRGWTGQRIEFKFPIMAIVGENGSGKSTIIQAAASIYKGPEHKPGWFPSDFFMETAWDKVSEVTIKYGYREGDFKEGSVRKPTTRWLGNVERPIRPVEYIDLSRIQPVSARPGYTKIAKNKHTEKSFETFDDKRVKRLSEVLGRPYDGARTAFSSIDDNNNSPIPVISKHGIPYSGFHQGAGETTIAELLKADLPQYGLILIDEIESSLHPRAQRRLIRDLAARCQERELQIIITTHSPYVLDELPLEARLYIMENKGVREIISSVSPQFAMTKMDDEPYPECDLYVEDKAAQVMLNELLAANAGDLVRRCSIVPYGAASVGKALGQMVSQNRFPRPSCVFLDGDSVPTPGCLLLPGGDAPERVVCERLAKSAKNSWGSLWMRIGRPISDVISACDAAMTLSDHHEWVRGAANTLMCNSDTLWQAMCAEWAQSMSKDECQPIIQAINDKLNKIAA